MESAEGHAFSGRCGLDSLTYIFHSNAIFLLPAGRRGLGLGVDEVSDSPLLQCLGEVQKLSAGSPQAALKASAELRSSAHSRVSGHPPALAGCRARTCWLRRALCPSMSIHRCGRQLGAFPRAQCSRRPASRPRSVLKKVKSSLPGRFPEQDNGSFTGKLETRIGLLRLRYQGNAFLDEERWGEGGGGRGRARSGAMMCWPLSDTVFIKDMCAHVWGCMCAHAGLCAWVCMGVHMCMHTCVSPCMHVCAK